MTFYKELDNKIRFIVIYQDVTKKASRIQKILNIALSTIYDWIRKIEDNVDIFQVQDGRGKKQEILNSQKQKVIKTVEKNPNAASLRRIGAKHNMSKDSAHRVLKENDMIFTSTQKEYHTFTEEEKENRVTFCKSMLKRKGQPIDETFYSDEMGINIKDAHKSKVWTRKGNKKIKAEKPEETVKLNCWGAISSKGATSLHIYKENLNSDLYEEIIFDHKKEIQFD
ncbi:hypothetical protein ABPG72_002107 [Tetrahymena utriculariae]